jgi:hypothetical protein
MHASGRGDMLPIPPVQAGHFLLGVPPLADCSAQPSSPAQHTAQGVLDIPCTPAVFFELARPASGGLRGAARYGPQHIPWR